VLPIQRQEKVTACLSKMSKAELRLFIWGGGRQGHVNPSSFRCFYVWELGDKNVVRLTWGGDDVGEKDPGSACCAGMLWIPLASILDRFPY